MGAVSAARTPEGPPSVELVPGSDEWWDSKPRLLWTRDVGQLFEVSAKTVDRWAHEGRICPRYTLGGHRRFAKEEIRELWGRFVAGE